MKIQTLQGLNLESDHTLIKIQFDAVPDTKLLDLIAGYHPVLIRDYELEGAKLTVKSKLVDLWHELATPINNLATKVWDYDKTYEYIHNYVLKNLLNSMSTIVLLEAADKLNLEITRAMYDEIWTPVDKKVYSYNRYYNFGCGSYKCVTISASSTGDSTFGLKMQRDKFNTNTIASRLQMPIAKWQIISTHEELEEVFDQYPTPVVIKPAGLTQGSGVTTNIYDLEHALRAFDYAKEKVDAKVRSSWQKKIMIQQQVEGEDYRLLVVGGKLEVATKRIPAYVTGDGKSNIKELIEQTNKDPRRNMDNPAHTLKPIKFDQMLDEYLSEQGLDLEHVPGAKERVYVRKVASMSQGGMTKDYTDQVHPQIRVVAESMAASIHSHVVGFDVMCKDISKPLTAENGSIIEMNTMPEIYLNLFPTDGETRPEVAEAIITGLLDRETYAQKIVSVGKTYEELLTEFSHIDLDITNETIGRYENGSIFIDDQLIATDVAIDDARNALKLNKTLTTIIFMYMDESEIAEYGYGFDEIDVLIN